MAELGPNCRPDPQPECDAALIGQNLPGYLLAFVGTKRGMWLGPGGLQPSPTCIVSCQRTRLLQWWPLVDVRLRGNCAAPANLGGSTWGYFRDGRWGRAPPASSSPHSPFSSARPIAALAGQRGVPWTERPGAEGFAQQMLWFGDGTELQAYSGRAVLFISVVAAPPRHPLHHLSLSALQKAPRAPRHHRL